MWNQIILVAAAFGLGYYFATRGEPDSAKKQPVPTADGESMAGAFPEETKNPPSPDKQPAVATHASLSGKKKPKKGSKSKKHAKKTADKTDERAVPSDKTTTATAATDTSGPANATTALEEPTAADQPNTASEPESDSDSELLHAVQEDAWETVGTEGYRPQKTASKHIPVHESAWGKLEPDKDLGKEPEPKPAARVLRIGAAARPAPARRAPRDYAYEEELTKKQRQNMRKEERKREEKAYAAELQAQRLRQHQRELVEVRSREQWERAKRKAANASTPVAAGKSKVNGKASVFEDKLIWD